MLKDNPESFIRVMTIFRDMSISAQMNEELKQYLQKTQVLSHIMYIENNSIISDESDL